MTRTQRRTRIKSGFIMAVALVFLIALLAVSFALSMRDVSAEAESISYVPVTADNVKTFIRNYDSLVESNVYIPQNGVISTKENFIYLFFAGESGNYTLGANFQIIREGSDGVWSSGYSDNDGKDAYRYPYLASGCTLNGAGHTILNSSTPSSSSKYTSIVGGLVCINEGTIQNLKYTFEGNLNVKKNTDDYILANKTGLPDAVVVGGMIGVNKGTVDACTIVIGGQITAEADTSDTIVYGGGMIGYNQGDVSNCGGSNGSISCNSTITMYSDSDTGSSDAKHCSVYAGGIVGNLGGGTFYKCSIRSSGSVISADNTAMWKEGWLDEFLSLLPEYLHYNTGYNGDSYIHPAGGVVGVLSGDGKLKQCKIESAGSALSYGMAGSGDEGCIAGGVVGVLQGTTAQGGLLHNEIVISGSLASFFMPVDSLGGVVVAKVVNTIIEYVKKIPIIGDSISADPRGDVNVWLGAVYGKNYASKLTFKNNFIQITADDGILEDGVDRESDDYVAHTGLLCGNSLSGLVGENNWMARKLSECGTDMITNNSSTTNGLKQLYIYGDGELIVTSVSDSQNSITVEASPICSPFYGWTSDLAGESPTFIRNSKTKVFNNSVGNPYFAVFIDTEICSSGELTQFAYDVNLIKNKAWAELGVTLSWLNAKIGDDVTKIMVEKGTPVIEEFYGTFNGNKKTIAFAAGSKISHDYEPDKDNDDKDAATPDYNQKSTGLFGIVKASATIYDLNLTFGGTISEKNGLEFNAIDDASDKISDIKKNKVKDVDHSVKDRVSALSGFAFPSEFAFDQVYVYFLKGSGYSAAADFNPGYITVIPYTVNNIVGIHNVGILCGTNYGTVNNVTVEATKSAYINVVADIVRVGALCGANYGMVSNASVTMNGKIIVQARSNLKDTLNAEVGGVAVGGLLGLNAPSSAKNYVGLSSFVNGEIKITKAENYHLITYYEYGETIEVDGNQEDAPDEQFVIAYEGEEYYFAGIDAKATRTAKIKGSENLSLFEAIGSLIGAYSGAASTLTHTASVSGAKGGFNTVIYQPDSEDAYVGAVIGFVDASSGHAIPTFSNGWAVMDYEEYKAGASGRLVFGSGSHAVKTGVNLVYVQTSIAIAEVNTSKSLPVSFTLEAREGLTFSGWYDYTSGAENSKVITAGLVGDVFTPQNQNESNVIYVAEVISLQLFTEAEVKKLSRSTNEGRGYYGVTFTIGGDDISLTNFTPIGTEAAPFLGTLDGNGLTVKITSIATGNLAGLFGCIGENGTVKNITVRVTGAIGGSDRIAAGAIAAINKGTIGQDLSTGKIVAELLDTIEAKNAGGLVGINRNVVKNAEVKMLYSNITEYGRISIAGENASTGGGAIGFNESVDATAYAKNIIVYYEGRPDTTYIEIPTKNVTYFAGGVIGKNGLGSVAYSLVSVVKDDLIFGETGSAGGSSKFRGFIIGYNESQNTDALWMLYLSSKYDKDDADAALLGAPVSIYTAGVSNVQNLTQLVLLNGEDCSTGNALIRYGRGSVEVSISGAESEKGGQISFFSSKIKTTKEGEKAVDFYDYVANFASGERVSVADGNTGFTFSPVVGTKKTSGLVGKIYYAGFCNASIANENDYVTVQKNVANDYRLYVEYNVTNNFTLDASTATASIGNEEYPFYGSINGNAYTVTMNSTASMHAFVGVLGDSSDKNRYSVIKNLRLTVQSGSKIEEEGEGVSHGFLTDVNYGTIYGVNVTIRGYLKNPNGATGGVTGVNYGAIDSATVVMEYANYLGANGFGTLIGKSVGAVAGENYGSIGSKANSIDVTLKKSSGYGGMIYGADYAGGVVGLNGIVINKTTQEVLYSGTVRSVILTVSGSLMGKNVSALVGCNKATIESAFVTVEKGATVFGSENFGLIAAVNEGKIGEATDTPAVKGYLYASPLSSGDPIEVRLELRNEEVVLLVTTPAASCAVAGGAVGTNAEDGECRGVLVELHASLIAIQKAGGLIGDNAGDLSHSDLSTSGGVGIYAAKAGGIAGVNGATGAISLTFATTRGPIGNPGTTAAGGFASENVGSISTSVVTLYEDVFGTQKGLAAATSTAGAASNSWVQICNRSTTAVCSTANSGFNVIRVLNETLLTVVVDYDREFLTFNSQISGVKNWYTDISDWVVSTQQSEGILSESGLSKDKMKYVPSIDLTNKEYYVCYDNLSINTLSAFRNLATLINSRDYYNNVLFRLTQNIIVPAGTVLRPIGTDTNPFNGIFDGAYHTITMNKGSGISGTEYAGLFGYVAPSGVLSNFLLLIDSGVSIGSVNSFEIGALVGRNYGLVKNVFVNLSTSITSNSGKRAAGAMIGMQMSDVAPVVVNSWVSILNEAAPAVGNMAGNDSFGVNYIGVLGNGITKVEFAAAYSVGTEDSIRYRCYVPTTGTAQVVALSNECFKSFEGWFAGNNISDQDKIKGENGVYDDQNGKLGIFRFILKDDPDNDISKEISFTTYADDPDKVTGVGKKVTLSFIPLTITNEEGRTFKNFANNINTYGDQGATFTLTTDITVDFNDCSSVGTLDRPFTGTFDGQGHTITITGDLINRDYAGVFGFVGVGGVIKNVIIDASGSTVGDGKALYSGVAAALLFGELKNVVVLADADTVVYTTQGLASSGGLVGRAGKIDEKDEANNISYRINNAWLVLAEGATVTNAVGEDPDLTHPDYYRANKAVCGVGKKMQIVGEGVLKVSVDENAGTILFNANGNGSDFYGFIDNAAMTEEGMKPVHDGDILYRWTVTPRADNANEDPELTCSDMLCVIINRYISTVGDLLKVAENVSKGRNYRGITYELTPKDASGASSDELVIKASDLPNGVFTPIGGEVKSQSSGGFEGYVERDFIGGFNGKRKTIRFEYGVQINARYAGLFGRVGAEARIFDLVVEADCKIGLDTQDNTTRTLYAGVLAGYAAGGSFKNVVVVMEKRTTLYGSVSTGRAFGYLPREAGNVAANCWVVSYNSKENYELNAAEIAYNALYKSTFDQWLVDVGIVDDPEEITNTLYARMLSADRYYDPDYAAAFKRWAVSFGIAQSPEEIGEALYSTLVNNRTLDYVKQFERERMPGVGINQGGFNNLMVVAAGDIRLSYPATGQFFFSYDDSYWYALNDFEGEFESKPANKYTPATGDSRKGYNVSFLKSTIEDLDGLKAYAQNVNAGYNFYNLTFKLASNIEITSASDFKAIGVRESGVNGTFDGQGHTITVAKGALIEGEYAGLFGHVSSDGLVKNLRIVVEGTLGKTNYTAEEITMGSVHTLYAGAIAMNEGRLENVVVIGGSSALLRTRNGYAGLAIGYDTTNLVKNVWALVDVSSYVDTIGRSVAGDTGVNTMKIIGIGIVDGIFEDAGHDDYRIRFTTDIASVEDPVPVMGWYKSFEKNQQISSAMITGGGLYNGLNGYMIAPDDLFGVTYEVAVIKTILTAPADLIALAGDVNNGGYSFESITFSLGADVILPDLVGEIDYLSIGTIEHPFKGTFIGSLEGQRYTITIKKGFAINGIFGCNAGTIRDLTVVVNGTVGEQSSASDQIYGAIAALNKGVIESSYVEVAEDGKIVGYTVGGIAGKNVGTIRDCVVVVRGKILADTDQGNTINAGGIVGLNEGTVEGSTDFDAWNDSGLLPNEVSPYAFEANLYVFGEIRATVDSTPGAVSHAHAYAGGAVGNHYGGTLTTLVLYVTSEGLISAVSPDGSARAGAYVGYARSSVIHSVVFDYGTIESTGYLGGTAGYFDGVTALNVWQVSLNGSRTAVGSGARSVNVLIVKGNGKMKASVDDNHNVMFINITELDSPKKIVGWYTASGIEVDAKTGNVGDERNTFLPLMGVQNKTVTVIFVNTEIASLSDLVDMASSVSGGLSGDSIVFTLTKNLEIDATEADVIPTIGTKEYPFNNVFDGNGKTITFKNGYALPHIGTDYYGLFGYVGTDATIKDLVVVAKAGTYGNDASERTALVAAYNEGTLQGITVTVEDGAELIGQTVGAVAASSFGTVEEVTLTLEGKLSANGGDSTVVGGVIGVNDGTLSGVTATVFAGAALSASGTTTGYAGVVAGENYKAISSVVVTFSGELSVGGKMSAYSGVVAALNLGYVQNAFVEIDGGTFTGGVSGGLVGNNVNSLTTSLLKIVGAEITATDSVIGYTKSNDPNKVYNVWVYSDRIENVSDASCVNSLTYEQGMAPSCPTAEEVLAGKISFARAITSDKKKVDLFAVVENGACAAGSGAAMDNVVYADGKITLVAYDIVGLNVEVRKISDVRVCLTARNVISSGSELYAFAVAASSGVYTFENATVTLGADFELPERAFPLLSIPATLTLDGAHHVVTVGNATLTNGLFQTNDGTIKNIGLRLNKAGTVSASFVYTNLGSMTNVVVYLEEGVSVTGGRFFVTANGGTTSNLWLVVREEETTTGLAVLPYSVMRIHGVGALLQGGEEGLTFTAQSTEPGMIFVGYTSSGLLPETDPDNILFDTAGKATGVYTAEFLSVNLDSDYKLQVLSDVSLLGYKGENVTFTLGADLTASKPLFGSATAFLGTLNGQGYTLTAATGVVGSLFGTFAGEIKDIVIDLTALSEGEVKLFDGTATVKLIRVVVKEARADLWIGAPVLTDNVWIDSDNADLKAKFMTASDYAAYSLLYRNGVTAYAFGDAITVTAEDTNEQVFAGYFVEKGASVGSVGKSKTHTLVKGASVVTLNYINRILSTEDDLARLASGVTGGFDFAGVNFYVKDNGFSVTSTLETIGDETHAFKGNVRGGSHSEILFTSLDSSFTVNPFLYALYGTLCDVIFRYDSGASFTGMPTLVVKNYGSMSAVVVQSENEALFEGGAALTLDNEGETINCWFVTRGKDGAVKNGSLVGVNELRLPYEKVDEETVLSVDLLIGLNKTSQGTKVNFVTSPTPNRFVCYYDFEGKVVFPGNYTSSVSTYTAPATSSGVKITVRDINTIEKEDELVYLGYYTKLHPDTGFVVTLSNDLKISRHLNTVNFANYTFDLAGKVLTLAATTDDNETLFNAGTVRNGSIRLSKSHYGIAKENATLNNVALFLEDADMTLPAYHLDGVVTVVAEHNLPLTAASGYYNFLYAPKGADLTAIFEGEDYEFKGKDSDFTPLKNEDEFDLQGKDTDFYYYFGGIVPGASASEMIAYFAPLVIDSEQDYVAFLNAANNHETHLAKAKIFLTANVSVDGTAAPCSAIYAGVLYANGHTVTITGGTYGDTHLGYLSVVGEGVVQDLALAFEGATIVNDVTLVSCEGEGSRIAVVVYQSNDALKQVETDAVVLNVYREVKAGVELRGEVLVTFGSTVRFTAVQSGYYALREWKNAAGDSLTSKDLVQDAADVASAHFGVRYLVTVKYLLDNPDEELSAEERTAILVNNAGNLPKFKGTGILFASDIEGAHAPIEVSIDNIGEGFLFRSLSYTSVVSSKATDAWCFPVTWTIGTYDIELTVTLTYVEVGWVKKVYDATPVSVESVILVDLRESLGAGYTVEYYPTPLGATPDLVENKPKHAGSYLVTFQVFKSDSSSAGRKLYCNAYGGLEITPAILAFKTISIMDKVYDGTTVATADGFELVGIYDDDKDYISFEGLTYAFEDANAEQGKVVKVSGDAKLAYKAGTETDSAHRYSYLNYAFDKSSITSLEGGLIRANITRRPLRLTISSITVDYLDQFDDNAPVFRPTLRDEYKSDLIAADEELFNALSASLMTREDPTCYDVGYYRIIVGDSFALPNYNVILTDSEAYYVVNPSLIKVVFDKDEAYYGDKDHTPAYHLFVGKADGKTYRDLREGDKLYFTDVVYAEGATLLPGEERYSFTCLFSAQNKNYKVESTEYEAAGGVMVPILTGNATLKVLPKTVTVVGDDARNVKRMGKRTEKLYANLATGNRFVEKDHVLVVEREAGEGVGSYKLSYKVKDGNGVDVTDRYTLVPATEGGYFFTITPVVIRIKPNKTTVTYGTKVDASTIKYGASVEGGGITIADLYYALKGTEKANATLADIGVDLILGYSTPTLLSVGVYRGEFSCTIADEKVRASVSVAEPSTENLIVVQKKYLTVTIRDYEKTYDGLKDFNESKVKFSTSGILTQDKDYVSVTRKNYRLIGDGVSVGVYKIDGEFEINSTKPGLENNYFITVVQGELTINSAEIKIMAEVGYFNAEGEFTAASITQGGNKVEHTIYYGDAKATMRYTVSSTNGNKTFDFLTLPDGSDKEQSDYLASTLKISCNRLNKLLPFYAGVSADAIKKTIAILGLSSANNNVVVTFEPKISIESVYLTIRVTSSSKVVGEPDPELKYEIIAQDPNDDYRVIQGYNEQCEGTFSITVTADRKQGETLGAYSYENIKIDIVNVYSGESLFDENTETGAVFSDSVEKDVPENLTLSIKQKGFMQTKLGKYLIYGGALFLLLVIVVLLLIFVPRIHKKRRAKKMLQAATAADLWNEGDKKPEAGEGSEPTSTDAPAEGGEQPAEAPAEGAETPVSGSGATETPVEGTPDAQAPAEGTPVAQAPEEAMATTDAPAEGEAIADPAPVETAVAEASQETASDPSGQQPQAESGSTDVVEPSAASDETTAAPTETQTEVTDAPVASPVELTDAPAEIPTEAPTEPTVEPASEQTADLLSDQPELTTEQPSELPASPATDTVDLDGNTDSLFTDENPNGGDKK